MKFRSPAVTIAMVVMVFSVLTTFKDLSGETNKNRWGLTINESNKNKIDYQDTQKKGKKSSNRDEPSKGKFEPSVRKQEEGSAKNADNISSAGERDNQAAGKKLRTEKSAAKPTADIDRSDKSGTQKKPDIKSDRQNQIKWKNKKQKALCEKYLGQLKELFLQARYYSIQGVPCGTAENAQAFIALADKCKRDCPDEFLRKNGYTNRIIRNVSWLEKLGTERCPDMNLPREKTDKDK